MFWIQIIAFVFTLHASDKDPNRLVTSYLTLELPKHWSCNIKKQEWVCKDQRSKGNHYALLTVFAKKATEEDSFASFKKSLSAPLERAATEEDSGGTSQVMRVSTEHINGYDWVWAHHFESSARNYHSFYLATEKKGLSILLTFVVNDKYEKTFRPYINDVYRSVRLKRIPKAVVKAAPTELKHSKLQKLVPTDTTSFSTLIKRHKNSIIMAIGFIIVGLLFISLALKKRR